jgi:hypothetical protein
MIVRVKPTRTRRQAIRRVRARLAKAGLLERAEALLAVAKGPEFAHRMNAECGGQPGDWIRTNHDVRKLATKILDEMKVDHRGIELTFQYDPATRKLDMWARPAAAVVRTIAEKAKLHAVGPGGRL